MQPLRLEVKKHVLCQRALTLFITTGKLPMVMNETMKDRLIAATISALEEHKGVQGIRLRGIAKAAGCSHVNAYNYVDGLPGLLWLAYIKALEAFTATCFEKTSKRRRDENYGESLARAMTGFALTREGLYRLLWFEALEGEPAGEALAAITRSKSVFAASTLEAFREDGLEASEEVLEERLDMLFAYLQGELALLINGRLGQDKAAAGKSVVDRTGRMWRLLTETTQ